MSDKSFDLDTVKKLAKLVKDNDLGEITVEDGDKKITVKGKACTAPAMPPMPMPFYAAPSPDSEPFVTVGSTVKKGDTIFIIESMKVMSEVQSEFDGTVKQILVNSGDPVDYDQTLMVIG